MTHACDAQTRQRVLNVYTAVAHVPAEFESLPRRGPTRIFILFFCFFKSEMTRSGGRSFMRTRRFAWAIKLGRDQ